jgi:hypothetical protein
MKFTGYMVVIGKVVFVLQQNTLTYSFLQENQAANTGMRISGTMKMYLLIPVKVSMVI